MYEKPLYQVLATLITARANCDKMGNTEWFERHTDKIRDLCREYLPRGSGFDSGTVPLFDQSTADKLVFQCDFHHMDRNGFYAGWSEHRVTVRPSLAFGFVVSVSGRNRDGIKEHISDHFHHLLRLSVDAYITRAA